MEFSTGFYSQKSDREPDTQTSLKASLLRNRREGWACKRETWEDTCKRSFTQTFCTHGEQQTQTDIRFRDVFPERNGERSGDNSMWILFITQYSWA
ncbi:hypothetical protein INR49_030629 [Caranx melampygus]|nr:hypothetical protein INR49_030629 [Caranx melampygus]